MIKEELIERRYRTLGRGAPLFYDTPLHIVKGKGVHLYDASGKAYLDAYNNVPVVGHCHPRVVDAIARQAATLNIHTRYVDETVVQYAEQLTATFDRSLNMAIFTCTGSEANDVALRIARSLSGKMGIICSNSTYHGNSAAVDELSTMFRGGRTTSANVRAVPFPDSYRPLGGLSGKALEDAYVDAVRETIEAFEDDGIGFAGMLVCPIFANEGLPVAPAGYMKRVTDLVRAAGGLLIFDEVQSGFGRTGVMWGQDAIGVVPDIVTMGKPMGNGHPVGGVVARTDLVDAFRQRVMYFNTFGGNPVSSAAGLAVLSVIRDEHLLDNVRQVGTYLSDGLHQLQQRHPLIGDVRGTGLFFAVELVADAAGKAPAAAQARKLVNWMKDRGVLISRIGPMDNILKIRPPLLFSKQNADTLLNVLDEGLAALKECASS